MQLLTYGSLRTRLSAAGQQHLFIPEVHEMSSLKWLMAGSKDLLNRAPSGH